MRKQGRNENTNKKSNLLCKYEKNKPAPPSPDARTLEIKFV